MSSESTDVEYNGKMRFVKPETEGALGFYGMPSLSNLWNITETFKQTKALFQLASSMETKDIILHDARKREDSLSYKETGFCLMPLESEVQDWAQAETMGSKENLKYQEELRGIIRKLHPTVKRIEFFSFMTRGGNASNPPASNGPHLDVNQDRAKAEAFRRENEKSPEETKEKEKDKFGDGMKMMLGLWQPLQTKNPVYDHPLVFIDASTFRPDEEVTQETLFTDFVKQESNDKDDGESKLETVSRQVVNLSSLPKFHPDQKWYYYPEQTHKEVTVFRHWTKDEYLCNMHGSVDLELPEGMETRSSIETRANLFF